MAEDASTVAADWRVWQLVDSAFPTGSFAHSLGLESAWHHGEVADTRDLQAFVRASLLQAAHSALPLLNDGYRAPDRLDEWDALNDAFLTNVAANRASRVQGRTLAATAARIWPHPTLDDLVTRTTSTLSAHVAPIFGMVFRHLGVSLPTARQAFLFSVSRGVLSASVRLGIAGSYESQQIQSACVPWATHLLDAQQSAGHADLAQTSPIIDILQGAHDRLYSRLFQS